MQSNVPILIFLLFLVQFWFHFHAVCFKMFLIFYKNFQKYLQKIEFLTALMNWYPNERFVFQQKSCITFNFLLYGKDTNLQLKYFKTEGYNNFKSFYLYQFCFPIFKCIYILEYDIKGIFIDNNGIISLILFFSLYLVNTFVSVTQDLKEGKYALEEHVLVHLERVLASLRCLKMPNVFSGGFATILVLELLLLFILLFLNHRGFIYSRLKVPQKFQKGEFQVRMQICTHSCRF